MQDILMKVREIGLIPVIALDDAGKAADLARALDAGGVPAAEVTFRTAAGEEAIRRIARECPGVLLGAGTVLTVDQCRRATDAGARFVVSPGYSDAVVEDCLKRGVPVLPGCTDASDMTKAACAGLEAVKFFPAEASGGLQKLKALAPVFPGLRFMPTGGVNAQNLTDYLAYDRVLACGGTWMVKKELIAGERWDEITRICRDATRKMLAPSVAHVGLNQGSEEQAEQTAKRLCDIFGLPCLPGASSVFAGGLFEVMNAPGRGEHGHIAIRVGNVDRAIFQLSRAGVAFDEASRIKDASGFTKVIYLRDEIAGFALHLVA